MQKVKLFTVAFGILAVGLLGLAPTAAFAQQETSSTMTILGTCGITIGSAMTFDAIEPDGRSSYEQLDITPTGNGDVVVNMFGGHWLDTTDGTNIINGEKTKFAFVNATDYDSVDAIPLNSSNNIFSYGTIDDAGGINSTFWQVEATLNTGFVGSVQQTMTFTVSECV